MQDLSLKKFSKEEIKEMALLELAYELMIEKNQPVSFNDLVKEVKSLQKLTEEEIKKRISQFYTDLNVDGRFTSLGDNKWGLKDWYPVDQIEDEVVHTVKPKKKKAKKAVVEDFDDIEELEEELDVLEEDIDDLDDDEDDDDDDEVIVDEILVVDEDAEDDDFEADLDEDLIAEDDDDLDIDEDEEAADEE